MMMSENQYIQRLLLYRDIPGLVAELRCLQDPDHREQAARALREVQDSTAISWLIQSALYDPDSGVKRAVREVLQDLIGRDLEMALQVEASGGPPEGSWLVDPHLEPGEDLSDEEDWDYSLEEEELEEGKENAVSLSLDELEQDRLTNHEQDEIRGLIMIATGESNPALRLRAVQALGKFAHMGGFRTLAELSVSEEDESVRQAAHAALEKRFGDHLPAILDGFGLGEEEDEGEDETEEEDDESHESPSVPAWTAPTLLSSQPPVVQEEKIPGVVWWMLLLGAALFLGLLWTGVIRF